MSQTPLFALLVSAFGCGAFAQNAPADGVLVPPPPPDVSAAGQSDEPKSVGDFVSRIMREDDPETAALLLGSTQLQDALRAADPVDFPKLFEHAAELRDMEQMLMAPANLSTLRLNILSRAGCRFCQNPERMEAWAARDRFVIDAVKKELPEVFWDWRALADSQRAWVVAHGDDAKSWERLTMLERRGKLDGWAQQELDALSKLNPSTPAEVRAMGERIYVVFGIVGAEKTQPVLERLNQASVAVAKLAQARMTALPKDRALRQALADAQNAADPAARLAALNRLFDGLGRPDAAVRAAAPAAPGQIFDDRSRKLTADLLRGGLMREISGTWAGDDLAAFFKDHPLNIAVGPTQMAAIAWYQNDVLSFNEKFIQEYVKARGKNIDDLARDPVLLGGLIHEVAPTFVHEATHQEQDAWAKKLGIPFYGGEGPEKEAMTVQSLYVLQKEKLDASYRRYAEANVGTSTFVREDLALAQDLRQSGANWFGELVWASHYAGFPSIASNAWTNIALRARVAGDANAELARRAKRPAAEQQRLAAQADFAKSYPSVDALVADFPKVGGDALRDLLGKLAKADAGEAGVYDAYQQRLNSVDATTDERLKTLNDGAAPRDAVPLPATVNH